MREKITLLGKDFLFLLLSNAISSFGDWVQKVALTIYFFKITGSAFDVSLYFLLTSLPDVVLAPFIGIIIDKYNKKKLLVISELVQGILVVFLLFINTKIWLMIIILITSIFKYVSIIGNQSIVPEIVDEQNLIRANSLIRMSSSSMRILGPALAGILTSLFSIKMIFAFNSLTFFVASGLYSLIKYIYVYQKSNEKKDVENAHNQYNEYFQCIRYFIKNKVVFYTTLLLSIALFVSSPINVLVIKFIMQEFNNEFTYGIFISAMGIGYICGGVLLNIFDNIRSKFKILSSIIFIDGIINLLIIKSNEYSIIILALSLGIISCIFNVLDETIVQEYTFSDYRGRVFSIHNILLDTSYLLSIFLGGIVLMWTNLKALYILSGFVLMLSSFAYYIQSKRIFYINKNEA